MTPDQCADWTLWESRQPDLSGELAEVRKAISNLGKKL